jgi:HPt (histidine-containing phosphotransfer) domain-containing protein
MNRLTDPAETASVAGQVFLDRLAHLRRRFVERAREDAAAFRALRDRRRAGEPLEGELLLTLTRRAHALAGSAGVFGFEPLSEAAHRLERMLRGPEAGEAELEPLFDRLDAELSALDSADPTT